jgi:hypothetical protein
MSGVPHEGENQVLKDVTVGEAKQMLKDGVEWAIQEINQAKEHKMAKEPNESGMPRHKRLAMGEKVELKKGGVAKKKEHKAKKK